MSPRTKYRIGLAWRLALLVAVVYLGDDLGRAAVELWQALIGESRARLRLT